MNPCSCGNFKPGEPWAKGQCVRCWLYSENPDARAHWDALAQGNPTPLKSSIPERGPQPLPPHDQTTAGYKPVATPCAGCRPLIPCGDITKTLIHRLGADKAHRLFLKLLGKEVKLNAQGDCVNCEANRIAMNAACAKIEAWLKRAETFKFWKRWQTQPDAPNP